MKRGIEQTIFIMFALIVFLVITIIAIQMFLRGTEQAQKIGQFVDLETAKKQCEAAAPASPPLEYCKSVFSIDINKDGKVGGEVENPKTGLRTCETSVFCYSILDRPSGATCTIELCKYFIDTKMLTPEEATVKVFGRYKSGDIDLTEDAEDLADIIENIARYEKEKDKGEVGILFVGDGCYADEVYTTTWRGILSKIMEQAVDTDYCEDYSDLELIISSDYNTLAISSDCIRQQIIDRIAPLYPDREVPNYIPLCAVLRNLR